MKISNLALVAALAFTGITASNASLTLEQSDVMDRTSNATLAALLTEFPPVVGGHVGSILTQAVALGGTDAAYAVNTAQATPGNPLSAAESQGGAAAPDEFLDGAADFRVNATGVQADHAIAAASVDGFADQRAYLQLMFDRLAIGIAAGGGVLPAIAAGDGNDTVAGLALLTAGGAVFDPANAVTRDNVTMAQIVEAIFTIRIKD